MQVRTLSAGLLIAVASAALVLVGGPLGVVEAWPVLLVAAAGLLVGIPRLRHALALAVGIVAGSVTVWATVAVLPPVPLGRAVATASGVLALTIVTLATAGTLRLSLQLVGWVAALAAGGPTAEGAVFGGAPLLVAIASDTATLLLAAGLGLLLAQVVQLVMLGRPGTGRTAAGLVAVGTAVAVLAAPAIVHADVVADPLPPGGIVEHRQVVVRGAAPDGTPTGGSVVTWLSATGTGDVVVTLDDQAVRGLRNLTGVRTPDVVGRRVVHRLPEGGAVRTAAPLDRALPVELSVTVLLDGRPVTPTELRGASGRLTVTYTVTNLTTRPEELRISDGARRARTVVRDVSVPFVGGLTVQLDDRFRAVRSPDGEVTASTVEAELLLAGGVGEPVRTVTWSADVTDAALPPVQLRVMPVALGTTPRGDVEIDRIRAVTAVLRETVDIAGVARDRTAALGPVTAAQDGLVAGTVAQLEVLIAEVAAAGADLDEVRVLFEAQDERVRAGDGYVHPLLDASGVRTTGPSAATRSTPRVEASVLYVIEVAEQGAGTLGVLVRLVLAMALLLVVGLLGRATGRLVGSDRP